MNSHADLTIENASIWSDDLERPASFAAVSNGRFVHVGEFDDSLIGASTRRLNADGHTVLPGLIDAHLHMLWGGIGLNMEIDLRPATSREDFARRIASWIHEKNLEPTKWICGGRWSTDGWPTDREPNRDWIDGVTGDRPCLLFRMDGHSALTNSAGLLAAGITAQTPDPQGGRIVRESSTGRPTGLLRESAIELVARLRPQPTIDEQVEGCMAAAREALRWGITSVGDIVEYDTLDAYRTLAQLEPTQLAGSMVRFFMYVSHGRWEQIIDEVRQFPDRPMWIQVAGLKDYMDGSLGSQTAAMREPYIAKAHDRTTNFGLFMDGIREGRLVRNLNAARRARMQPIYHAIGDEACHILLNALQDVYRNDDELRQARARIEHAQHLLQDDVARFGRSGTIASMQPYHKYEDARSMPELIGADRCRRAYMFRSLLDAGTKVAFGSDWPVVWMNPFAAMETAVHGTTAAGPAWCAEESISIHEALRCYTTHAAYAIGAEDQLGRIAPGYRADFIMLDQPIFDVDQSNDAVGSLRPLRTVIEGRVAYERG